MLELNDPARLANFRRSIVRLSDHEAIGFSQWRHHRAVLDGEGRDDEALRAIG
jgi:hypothetical protein